MAGIGRFWTGGRGLFPVKFPRFCELRAVRLALRQDRGLGVGPGACVQSSRWVGLTFLGWNLAVGLGRRCTWDLSFAVGCAEFFYLHLDGEKSDWKVEVSVKVWIV